jgi:hypothetical protein
VPTSLRSRTVLASAVLASVTLAGCGSGPDYKNADRPAAPVNVTASVTDKRISVSPTNLAAGPVVIIISNQSSTKQTVTWQTQELGGSQPGQKASSGPIGPRDTATIQVDPPDGTYSLSTRSSGIKAAAVTVKGKRKSAQDQLLQP